jgi:hypothetical protein
MAISVTEPISLALARTKLMLFQPFDLAKWFVVGFGAWLAQLGEGGFNGNFQAPSSGRSRPSGPGPSLGTMVNEATTWVHDHLALLLTVTIIAVCIGFAFYVLLLWLSSRGKFIFLDNVALNRPAIKEPWTNYAPLARSLMWFRMTFQLIGFNVFLLIAAISFIVMLPDLRAAWPDIEKFTVGTPTILAIVLGGGALLVFSLAYGFFAMCVDDFVVPLMYLRGTTAWPTCKEFMATMLRGNFWKFVLYALMKMVLSIGCGIAATLLGCVTCCIGLFLMALPYVGIVVLLPVVVFLRCYAIYFFEQFGPSFRIMVEQARGGFEVIMDVPPTPSA